MKKWIITYLTMNKSTIVSILQEQKETLTKRFGINRMGLFGSYAKGQEHSNSDIDLVYELQQGISLTFSDLLALEQLLSEKLEHSAVELVNFKYMNPIIKYDMQEDVIYV